MFRMRMAAVLAAVSLTACGGGGGGDTGGGGGITPPPPTPVVTTVEVTPTSTTLLAPATAQLTAVARDANGATMSRSFTWTSSAPSIASVSSGGLVTAVSAGSATITAATDGKQGSAAITVVASQDGPVVARGDVSPAGGTVGTDEIAVTIPSGALATNTTITLVRDTLHRPAFTEGAITANYTLDGLPNDRVVNVRVRIRTLAPASGTVAIAVTRPTLAFADSVDELQLGTTLVAAQDSAGFLQATVPLRGRPAAWTTSLTSPPGSSFRSSVRAGVTSVSPQDLKAAAELSGLMQLTRVVSTKGNFEVWGFGNNPTLVTKATKVAMLMEQARDQILSMGYTWDHRTTWPMQAYLASGSWNGVYYSIAPDPFDPNLGYVAYNVARVDLGWFPGTVIHELFHFTQTAFTRQMTWAEPLWRTQWLNEVFSTWIAEKHPAVALPYNHPTALSWADSLWGGLSNGLVANSGYGKAPMGKWLAETYGEATIRQMYRDVQNGANPVSAFLLAFPGPREAWYPQFLKAQLEGRLYSYWPMNELWPHAFSYSDSAQAGKRGTRTEPLLGLATEALLLKRDPTRYGADYSLAVALDVAAMAPGTLTAFRHVVGAPAWLYVGTGDTVRFTSAMLRSTDDLAVLVTNIDAKAPYNTTWRLKYLVDQSLPEGDVQMTSVAGLNNGIRFVCERPGDSVTFDPAENVTDVWSFFSNAGQWKKTQENVDAAPYATYTWSAYPAVKDSLAAYGLTMESTMEVLRADTIHVHGRLKWSLGSASLRSGGAGSLLRGDRPGPGGLPLTWWTVAVVAAGTPLVLRRKGVRRALPLVASGVLVLLVGCTIGLISMTIDESFDYAFVKPRFVSNLPNARTALVDLTNGGGRTTMNNYRIEHWVYFTTAGKPDSVKSVCTGSGSATYVVGGAVYPDSVKPAAPLTQSADARFARLGRALGLDLRRMSPAMREQVMALPLR